MKTSLRFRSSLFTIFACFATLIMLAQSPTWQWAKRCGTWGDNIPSVSGKESFNDVKVDKNGNVYAVGNFFANPVFQNAQLFGQTTPLPFAKDDAYLIKYNSCGSLLWWRRMGGGDNDGANSLVLDNTGKVIVTGYCLSTAYFSGGANSATVNMSIFSNYQFIAKFDTSGTLLSVNTYTLGLMKLFLNSQGNYFITDGLSAANINTLGVVTSTMAFFSPNTPSYPTISDIKIDRNDNIYLCGVLADTVYIVPSTTILPIPSVMLPGSFAGNSLAVKLNNSGSLLWYQRSYNNTTDGLAKCSLDTSETKIAVSGRAWTGCVVFGYTLNTVVGNISNSVYFLNTFNGNPISITTGSANGQAVVDVYSIDRDNNFWISGNTNGFFALGNTTLTVAGVAANRQNLIGKLNSSGNFISMSLMPQIGSQGANEKVYAAAISEQGNVYLCGQFSGTKDSLGTAVNIIGGVEDGFVAKFGFPCGSTLTALSPLAPTSLTAVYQGSLSNLVNWVDNSNYESGFELWYSNASPTFSFLTTLPANTTTYTHSGLTYTTTYCYKTRAINNIGPSVFTNSACATTPVLAAPQAPTNLTAINTGSLVNNVAWLDNSFNESGFELWYHGSSPTFSLLTTLPANTTTYSHSGLSYTTTYCYKALATNTVGSSVFTNTDCATTPQAPLPNAPTNLTAANTGSLSNNVNWLDNSNNETGFELWYYDVSPTFSLLTTLPANSTSFIHNSLTYTTTYCYKALATNSVGASVFTNTDCASTPAFDDVGILERSSGDVLNIYPNPTSGLVTLKFVSPGGIIKIDVMDLTGRVLQTEKLNTSSGENTKQIQLPKVQGMYFLKIYTGELPSLKKVVVE